MTDVTLVYHQTLDGSAFVPAPVQRAAWAHARRTGNNELTRRLVRRVDAPEDLVSEYAASTDQVVRTEFLSRPDLTPARLAALVAHEKRAAVLAEVLTRSAHPVVVAAATRRFTDRPSRTLAAALLRTVPGNQWTGDLLEQVLDTLAPASTVDGLDQHTLACLGVERATRLLRTSVQPQISGELLGFDGIDLNTRVDNATRVVTALMRRYPSTAVSISQYTSRALNCLAGRQADFEAVAAAIVDAADFHGTTAPALSGALRGVRHGTPQPTPWPTQHRTPDVVDVAVADDDLDVDKVQIFDLDDLAVSVAPTVRAGVVARVVAHLTDAGPDVHPGRSMLVGSVARLLDNPTLTPAERDALRRVCLQVDDLDLSSVDVHRIWPNDEQLGQTWCHRYPHAVFTRHGWAPFGGPGNAVTTIKRWCAGDLAGLTVLIKAALCDRDTDVAAVVPHVRWRMLAFSYHDPSQVSVRTAVAAYLVDVLGDNDTAWTTFSMLSGTFPGTLAELAATCSAAAHIPETATAS